jgi:hypothetical protein
VRSPLCQHPAAGHVLLYSRSLAHPLASLCWSWPPECLTFHSANTAGASDGGGTVERSSSCCALTAPLHTERMNRARPCTTVHDRRRVLALLLIARQCSATAAVDRKFLYGRHCAEVLLGSDNAAGRQARRSRCGIDCARIGGERFADRLRTYFALCRAARGFAAPTARCAGPEMTRHFCHELSGCRLLMGQRRPPLYNRIESRVFRSHARGPGEGEEHCALEVSRRSPSPPKASHRGRARGRSPAHCCRHGATAGPRLPSVDTRL